MKIFQRKIFFCKKYFEFELIDEPGLVEPLVEFVGRKRQIESFSNIEVRFRVFSFFSFEIKNNRKFRKVLVKIFYNPKIDFNAQIHLKKKFQNLINPA